MYIYQVNPDGISCAVQVHRKENGSIPNGWTEVPKHVSPHKMLFIVQGNVTNEKPQSFIIKEEQEMLIQEELEKAAREAAIAKLKTEGKLPSDYKDK